MGARAYYILSIRICKNRFCTVWEIYFIRLMSSAEPFFFILLFFIFLFLVCLGYFFAFPPQSVLDRKRSLEQSRYKG